MADILSLLNPQAASDQVALQRKMALAQALRQQSMQSGGQTEMLGGVAIQKSPLEGISRLFDAYQANKMDTANDADRTAQAQRQLEFMTNILGGQSNNQGGQSGGQALGQALGGSPGQSNFGLANLLRGGIINEVGGPGMGGAYADQFKMAPGTKELLAQGIDPTTMAPTTRGAAANKSGGVVLDAQGNASSIPNYGEVVADIAGKTKNAQEMNTIIPNVTLPSGAQVPMLGREAVGLNNNNQVKPSLPKQIGQSTASKEQDTTQGKFFGDTYAKVQQSAMDANAKLAKYDRMNSLLDGVNTGKLTEAGTNLAAWAKSAGFNIDPNLGNKQAALALTGELALQLRNPSGGAGMPGSMSNQDRDFLKSMTPSLANTPEGNKLIMEVANKLAKRDQEVATLARNYNNGKLDNGFYQKLQEFSDSHPMFEKTTPSNNSNGAKFLGFE